MNLVIGTTGDYQPFSFEVGGELRGFEVDLLTAAAKILGWHLDWQKFAWADLQEVLKNRSGFDVLACGLTVTSERQGAGFFCRPILRNQSLVVSDKPLTTMAATGSVLVNQGGYLESLARRTLTRYRIVTTVENDKLFQSAKTLGSEYVLTDAIEYASKGEALGFHLVKELESQQHAFFCFKKEICEGLDATLWTLRKNGEIQALAQKYGIRSSLIME